MEMFVLGPAYSGKSEWVLTQLKKGPKTAVIGTGAIQGLEPRIAELKSLRQADWQHFEDSALPEALHSALKEGYEQILIDSLNLWLANYLLDSWGKYDLPQQEARINHEMNRIEELLTWARQSQRSVLIVSSEVGAGVTPPDELTRFFRQHLGRMNQRVAKHSQNVVHMVAGLPNFLKKS